MANPYKLLYLLEHPNFSIFEIKRLDITSENPADIYFWFFYTKADKTLEPLLFISMSTDNGQEKRVFKQGILDFNTQTGSFIHQQSTVFQLKVSNIKALPSDLKQVIAAYFSSK